MPQLNTEYPNDVCIQAKKSLKKYLAGSSISNNSVVSNQ